MTVLFTIEEAELVVRKLKEYFEEQKYPIKESEKKYKMEVCCPVFEDKVRLNVRIERADENVRCIRLEKVAGNKMDFLAIFSEIKNYLGEEELIF